MKLLDSFCSPSFNETVIAFFDSILYVGAQWLIAKLETEGPQLTGVTPALCP